MPAELTRLASDLCRIWDAYPSRGHAEFRPTEPNLELGFSIGTRGQVEGTYVLVGDLVSGPTLRGSFTLEQAALQGIVADIREFVAASVSHAV
jgi:hypothetical protein